MATLADALRQTGYAQDGALVAPATNSPMTKALSEHIKTLPQQLATNQAALDSAIGSWNKTDFGTGQPNLNYRPEAIQELTQLMPNIGGLTAWHGTPHKIQGAFDISKVGTGEGSQAYGHGMYFAENPAVATEYRKALSGRTDLGQQPSDPAFIHAVESFREYGTPLEKIPAEMKKAYKSATDKDIQLAIQATEKGNLYKVDIPDEQIPNMLDWDKPLSKMTEKETAIIEPLRQALISRNNPYDPKSFETIGQVIQSSRGTNPNLEKELMEAGITGIRYLDAGSRPTNIIDSRLEALYQKHGGDLEKAADDFMRTIHESPKKKAQIRAGVIKDLENRPTSNFVVFDPSTVKILEENSKPVSRKALIEEQVKALKD